MDAFLLIVIILLLAGGFSYPSWPHSQNWGYFPFGTLLTIVIVLLLLKLIGRI